MATKAIVRATRKGCPNHPIDFKRRLAAQACEPTTSVAKLALVHGLNANLLFKWRRQYRAGQFGVIEPVDARPLQPSARLLPVVTTMPPTTRPGIAGEEASAIEIVLPECTVRVRGEVNPVALTSVLDCLSRRR